MAPRGSNEEQDGPSGVDELSWKSAAPQAPGPLLYDPLEPEPGQPAAPPPGSAAADGSSLLFRLALGTAALLVLFVFGGLWWSGREPRRSAPEPAAGPRSPVPPPHTTLQAPPAAEPTLIEELAREPAHLEKSPPKPAAAKPAAPKEPEPRAKPAGEPAAAPRVRRLPPPWEEGPQPPDLLKPGPGIEEPVPLAFPRYGYPTAARGTGLRADVRVAVLVDETGRVIDARVREGAPPDLGFSETALAAARRMTFQPATRNGAPGKMWTEVILEFAE